MRLISARTNDLINRILQKWDEDQPRDDRGQFSSVGENPVFHLPEQQGPATPVEAFSPKRVRQELGVAEDRMRQSVSDIAVAENAGKKSGWAEGTATMLTSSALSSLRASISGLDRLAGDSLDPDTKAAADRAKNAHAEAKRAFLSGGPSQLVGQKIRNALSATAVYYSHVARSKSPSRVAASIEMDGIRKILSDASEAMLHVEAKHRAEEIVSSVMRRFL
jgi:hypothetical protein